MVKKYLLYLLRWQISTPILAVCVYLLSPHIGSILTTIVANLIGGLIFFWVDKLIFGKRMLGALVALTMCLVMVIVTAFRTELPQPEQCAWLALMSIAGTWAVMLPSKLWEGTQGDTVLRRFTLMVMGLGLGVLAWEGATWFMVELPYDPYLPSSPGFRMPTNFYQGGPLLLAYMAVFGTLMLTVRWWCQADPLRPARLSLWSLCVTVVAAALVAWLWHFPQPWLMMIAGAMSAAVQLASPWLPPSRRQVSVSEED